MSRNYKTIISALPAGSGSIRGRFLILSLAYVVLAGLIRFKPWSNSDLLVTRTLQANDHRAIESFMTFVSWFGFRPQSLILPFSTMLTFWWRGYRLEAILLVFAWFSSLLSFLTKLVVRRPRPDHSVVRVVVANTRDTSFPSGHTVHYVTFWGFVSYLLLFRTTGRNARAIAKFVMLPLIAIVGPSRVYLGHHWFTDVLGSYLLGGAYLSGLIEVHRILREHDYGDQMISDSTWVDGAKQWLR